MSDASRFNALAIGQCASLACLLEVSAPKPGNVHRHCDFEDATFVDFALSAVAIGPAMEEACRRGVGPAVLEAIRATRALTRTNTNLGTVLLLAPLAAVPRAEPLRPGVRQLLTRLTARDSADVYAAIRLAQPGGLGRVDTLDVADAAPADLLAAMRASSERDLVAHQYVSGFATVLDQVLPWLLAGPGQGWSLADTIVHTQLRLLSRFGDSLIARKCGPVVSGQASVHATRVLEAGVPGTAEYQRALSGLDLWLRGDQHRRNPGTTADLIAAGLFAALRDNLLHLPF
jgi:triphosphoribosyl-dephospho-CoA synthase